MTRGSEIADLNRPLTLSSEASPSAAFVTHQLTAADYAVSFIVIRFMTRC
jgi:hypothetical protein